MRSKDKLNMLHIGDQVIIAATELMANQEPSQTDLQLLAIDLETAARKIRLYAATLRQEGRSC